MSNTTQLMLTAPCVANVEPALRQALDENSIACVIIVPEAWTAGSDETEQTSAPQYDPDICQVLVDLVQSTGAAALLANDADLAGRTGSDGCHLDEREHLQDDYETARRFLGRDASIGAMPGLTKHAAMTLAEAGADYVGYAVSGNEEGTGIDMIRWWSEIFETPVVAFTDGSPDACRLALLAGPPDFLAVPLRTKDHLTTLPAIIQLISEHGTLPTT